MDINNAVIRLCQQGAEAEFRKNMDEACRKYNLAWETANSDYEACIAAHYVARCQETAQEELDWNLTALKHARQCDENMMTTFWGSLYVNVAYSYEKLGFSEKAERYYRQAAQHGMIHKPE